MCLFLTLQSYNLMTKIGLISDTHGYFDPQLHTFFAGVDEIWHAGDIGKYEVVEKLREIKPIRAVYGNIDDTGLRSEFSENLRFYCEKVDVWIKHIGGYPKKYDAGVRPEIFNNPPGLFISGHSHILKVMYDDRLGTLHINPGAAGKSGFHQVRTAVRFQIDGTHIQELEVIELEKRK